MHDLPILINITLALVVAFIGGVIARRIGLPTIVGYLLAGIVIGPFTPGFVGDTETIQQLAEMGVIFLMFGVGLHFSFQDLWKVRDIAIPGALIQTALATVIGFSLTQAWGWTPSAGIVLGLAISVASTVVLLRGLMDNSLLNTSHGKAAVGWLVMEDILSVLILVLMPVLSTTGNGSAIFKEVGFTLLKAAAFAAIMFFAGSKLIPWILNRIALTRSRELFIVAVLAITLGTAMGAAELFDVSLALGAFVAGAIVSQSQLSHQVGADLLPFREAFSVLFFVSVGMLVNPGFLWANIGQVILLTILVIIGKFLIVMIMGLFFSRPARTFLVIAVGLSQIGEFSFILGQGGLKLGLLSNNQYSLILAGALISITVNPFMYKLIPILEKWLVKFPPIWKRLDLHREIPEPDEDYLKDHVVIVGYGRVGKHLVDVLQLVKVPYLVIESDAEKVEELNQLNIATLYGDAANSEVITFARLEKAKALVVSVPQEDTAMMVVSAAHKIHPDLPIITRAESKEGVKELNAAGALHVVHPELEGGLEMVSHTLLELGYPMRKVYDYAESVRRDQYDIANTSEQEHLTLRALIKAFDEIEIIWFRVEEASPLIGKTLAESNIRYQTGASVVAMVQGEILVPNPKSATVFHQGDRVGLMGEQEQIEAARVLVEGEMEISG
ncbi:MAG: cation:proton antiporter domain-containing protein [Anaerolineaceae bacterium]